jgi:imidazole glycerol-phosphate synthase subunit HisH
MKVAIVDYGSGNLHSARKAFERAARETALSAAVEVTDDPAAVRLADRIVLPGVGAFGDCAQGLRAISGMAEALDEAVRRRGAPFLGICVGMQLLAERGLEYGMVPGLGWIGGEVVPIKPHDPTVKIPHMGWNTILQRVEHPLLAGIPTSEAGWHAYFVHSFHLRVGNAKDLVAETDHGGRITAMVARDNIAGTQFHPEKSQKLGLKLISNFLAWRP